MSILQGLDPQVIEEVFGDVPNLPAGFDVEYLPVTRANVNHMAVIIQTLQEDAAKMRAELEQAQDNALRAANLGAEWKERAEQAEAFIRRLSAAAADNIETQQARIAELERDNANQAKLLDVLRETIGEMEAELEKIRVALRGYADSDLASLAQTIQARNEKAEAELEQVKAERDAALAKLSEYEAIKQAQVKTDVQVAACSCVEPVLVGANPLESVCMWCGKRVRNPSKPTVARDVKR